MSMVAIVWFCGIPVGIDVDTLAPLSVQYK